MATPDFALVTIDRSVTEVWTRHDGKISSQRLAAEERVKVMGSQYTFHVAQFVPAAELIEEYQSADGRQAVTALQVAFADASAKPSSIWLEAGQQRAITTENGRLTVWFAPRQAGSSTPHRTDP